MRCWRIFSEYTQAKHAIEQPSRKVPARCFVLLKASIFICPELPTLPSVRAFDVSILDCRQDQDTIGWDFFQDIAE